MRTLVLLGVLLLVTLTWAGPGGGPGGGDRRPRPPKTPQQGGNKRQKPPMANEGSKGRLEFNLTDINRQIIVWPKGCVFGLRKLNCTSGGERCKPLNFALDTVKELDTCGGKQVGQAPGKNKRKRGADRDALKKLECVIESTDSCTIPGSSVSSVCINASATLANSSYFTFSLYIAKENGSFTYLNQEFAIRKGQTKFTLGYVGQTCCSDSGDSSCTCDDGVTGALDVSLRMVSPPGRARKNRSRGQGAAKVNEISFGDDSTLEMPSIVDVDGAVVQMTDSEMRVEESGSDSKISMCIRNVTNYFLYDPTVSASSSADSGDSTQAVDNEFGEGVSDNGANFPLVTMTGCVAAALLAHLMH